MDSASFAENIRLVIWDLDETFWQGTLEEGAVSIPSEHVQIVETLARRGIISSICSKNSFEPTKQRLEAEGLWDWFVFPMIDYDFKSIMIPCIIEQMGLRAETILFIDDNHFNRGEVKERIPGINVASEDIIPHLLSHPQLCGKPDPELTRLERYRVLQMKQHEIKKTEQPQDFLRDCEIQVSFHFDVLNEFDRIHDLVNRTNQLNFTKVRWNEDIETARREYEEYVKKSYSVNSGYIKVRDKFGYYGICGFFENVGQPAQAKHFLFSCRVLNMGVEQFVFQKLNFPWIKLEPPFVGSLKREQLVDWISIVEDAEMCGTEEEAALTPHSLTLDLHGPCELVQSAHYLRPYFNIVEEFQYPKEGWGIQRPLTRYFGLKDELAALDITNCTQLGLTENFGGFEFSALECSFLDGQADIGVFNFSLESEISFYRHVKTGLIIPLSIGRLDRVDITSMPAEEVQAVHPKLDIEQIKAMQREFVFHSRFDLELLAADLIKLREKLEKLGKPFIVVEGFDDITMIDVQKYHDNSTTNELVRQILSNLGNVSFVSLADFVDSKAQQIQINHFQRDVYVRVAEKVKESASKEALSTSLAC